MLASVIDFVSQYYKPLDTVDIVNKSIRDETIRKTVNWAIFIAGIMFLFMAGYALLNTIQTGEKARLKIQPYLFILGVMMVTDLLAVYFEGKTVIEDIKTEGIKRVKRTDWVSIVISMIALAVTAHIFWHHFKRYGRGKLTAKLDVVAITLVKMMVTAIVTYRAASRIF